MGKNKTMADKIREELGVPEGTEVIGVGANSGAEISLSELIGYGKMPERKMTNDELRKRVGFVLRTALKKGFLVSNPAVYYTAQIAYQLFDTMIISTEIPTAGVNVSGLVINPYFFESMTNPQMLFVLLHEALHLRLDHIKRLEGKHEIIGNVAGDLAINCMIEDWMDIKMKQSESWPSDKLIDRMPGGCFPAEGMFAPLPKYEATEWYYDELMKLAKKHGGGQGGGQQQGGQGQGQGQQQGQNGEPGGGGGLGDQPQFDEEMLGKWAEQMKNTGQITTDPDDPAKQAALNELNDKLMQKATEEAQSQVDKLNQELGQRKIQGGFTKEAFDDFLNGNQGKDASSARRFNRQSKAQSVSSGAAVRGVDGIVDRSDDEAMWLDILEPIRTKVLTEKKQYNHRRAVQISIADALSDDFGSDIHLKGRIWGYSAGGEVLVIVDTSGSTQDYWQLSIAKCVECISAMAQNKVVLRVVVFSDNDPSVNDEFVFFNGEQVEEDEFSHQSVVEGGKDLIPSHVVDVQDMIQQSTVETAKLVGTTITGGGGTAILPVVDKIKAVVGDNVAERFLVTVIITDAALYGPDVDWSRSQDVVDTFGEHVAWLFLDLYGEDYGLIVGEKKYLISCGKQ